MHVYKLLHTQYKYVLTLTVSVTLFKQPGFDLEQEVSPGPIQLQIKKHVKSNT